MNRHLLEVLIYVIAIDEILPSRLHFSEIYFHYSNLSNFISNCSFGVAVVPADSVTMLRVAIKTNNIYL